MKATVEQLRPGFAGIFRIRPVFAMAVLSLFLLTLLPAAAQDNFSFFTNSDGTLIVTQYSGPGGNVSIPGTNNGQLVTYVGDDLFSGLTNLTAATIPDTITNIGDSAFYRCTGLTNVALPNGLTTIGNSAFEFCGNLRQITIPGSLTSMGSEAFTECEQLTNLSIINGATSIGPEAFDRCLALGNVTIPASVTNIGELAFDYCTNMTAIIVDSDNPDFTSVDGVLFDKQQSALLEFPAGKVGGYSVPAGVTSIVAGAFSDAPFVTNIAIPPSVTNIDDGACVYCGALAGFTVDPLNQYYSSSNGALFDKNQIKLVQIPFTWTGTYNVPATVYFIGGYAFSYNPHLVGVTISSNVLQIGYNAFYSCTGLKSIDVDPANPYFSSVDGVLFEPPYALLVLCPEAKTGAYIVPDGTQFIGPNAFFGCSRLTSLTFPSTISTYGVNAFDYCSNLANAYFEGNAPATLTDYAFFGENPTIHYLPSTIGWYPPPVADVPTVPWLPQMQIDTNFGVQNGQFGFNIFWATNHTVTVEASTSLTSPSWTSLQTSTLTSNLLYFSDPQWSNYPARFYRLVSP